MRLTVGNFERLPLLADTTLTLRRRRADKKDASKFRSSAEGKCRGDCSPEHATDNCICRVH